MMGFFRKMYWVFYGFLLVFYGFLRVFYGYGFWNVGFYGFLRVFTGFYGFLRVFLRVRVLKTRFIIKVVDLPMGELVS